MNRILMRRIKYHRRPERFLAFLREMDFSNNKVSCGAFCTNRQINHKGISRFTIFCKIRKGITTYESDFRGRL